MVKKPWNAWKKKERSSTNRWKKKSNNSRKRGKLPRKNLKNKCETSLASSSASSSSERLMLSCKKSSPVSLRSIPSAESSVKNRCTMNLTSRLKSNLTGLKSQKSSWRCTPIALTKKSAASSPVTNSPMSFTSMSRSSTKTSKKRVSWAATTPMATVKLMDGHCRTRGTRSDQFSSSSYPCTTSSIPTKTSHLSLTRKV